MHDLIYLSSLFSLGLHLFPKAAWTIHIIHPLSNVLHRTGLANAKLASELTDTNSSIKITSFGKWILRPGSINPAHKIPGCKQQITPPKKKNKKKTKTKITNSYQGINFVHHKAPLLGDWLPNDSHRPRL